ncbi:MAG TPA: GntR family transcriptional regulator [Streptosporangiaceae bacterium]|nr:GntR family transcriptional regulator [Streptosporangiaceae bacterium]
MVTEPKYREIAEDLRNRIESNELTPGSQLPTEIELMEQYNASRNTVRDAIKLLTTRGLVETRAGQGTFVVEKINPFVTTLTGDPNTERGGGEQGVFVAEVKEEGRTATTTLPRVEIQQASRVIANVLRLEEGAQIVSRHQERFIDGIPYSMQTSYYPMALVLGGATKLLEATDIKEGTVAYLATEYDVQQVGYRDTIAMRAPNENEMAFFKLPVDGRISVYEIFRVGFDQNGERYRLTISVYPADRNRFRINVGEVPPRGSGPSDSNE